MRSGHDVKLRITEEEYLKLILQNLELSGKRLAASDEMKEAMGSSGLEGLRKLGEISYLFG